MDEQTVILLIGYLAGLFMAFNIGANDASNPTQTAVGSGALTLRQAIIMFSIFAAIGALAQGYMVIKTVGKGIVELSDLAGAIAAVLGAGLWILIATYKGLPVSTTHSIVGAVLGVGLSYLALGVITLSDIKFYVLFSIVLSWLTSPLVSIILAIILYRLFTNITFKYGKNTRRMEKIFKYMIIVSLLFSAYSFGANDVANATGVYVVITSRYMGLPSRETMLVLSALGSIGIALGAFTLGRRVINTVAFRITRLDYISGAAAGYANALAVWLFTTLPHMIIGYGMPISTTHASVSAVIGVGLAKKGLSTIDVKTVLMILVGWLLTLPVSALLSFTLHQILYNLI